jgi:LacI family transcriptional regulator
LVEGETGDGRGLLHGIAKYASLNGPWNFYRKPPYYRDIKPAKLLQEIRNWKPDGIILRIHESWFLEDIAQMNLPTILCTNLADMKGFLAWPSMVTDDLMIGKMASEYLLRLGFKNFAYYGLEGFLWAAMRGHKFADSLSEYGHTPFIYKPPAQRKRLSEQPPLIKWLHSLPKPVAVFACSDDRGLEVIEACKSADLHIPQDVAILGASNDDLACTLSNPQLSSIARDIEKAGYETAALLDELMQGKKMESQKIVLEPLYVVARQSTNILAIEDCDVVKAIHFIRNNSNKFIQVGDVVNETSVTQRTLLKKFRKLVGRSINEEILHSRIDHICRMLVETNLSISEMVLQVGYSDINHISRCFKKIKGMTPLAYHKKYNIKYQIP